MALNGRLPDSDLGDVQIGGRLRKDLVRQTDQMAYAFYRDRGIRMQATDAYRDIDTQWIVWRRYLNGTGAPAAYPGTSNHGWGQAVDFASGINVFGSASHEWMKRNASKFGYTHPYWARQGGGRDEAWHWEAQYKKVDAPYIRKPQSGEVGLGHSGDKVTEIQRLLNANLQTENHVRVDGDFGWGTAVAVVKFQTSRGLSGVGVVGPVTLDRLKRGVAPASAPTNDGPTIYFRVGTKKPEQIKKIQAFLNRGRGADSQLKVDGIYGSSTAQAVRAFQRKHGLKPVGVIGDKTLAAMKRLGLEL